MNNIAVEKGNVTLFYWALGMVIFGVFLLIAGVVCGKSPAIGFGLFCTCVNSFVLFNTNDIKKIVHSGYTDYIYRGEKNDGYYIVFVNDLIPKHFIIGTFFSNGSIVKIKKNEELIISSKFTIGNRSNIPNSVTMTMGEEEVNAVVIKTHNPYIKD